MGRNGKQSLPGKFLPSNTMTTRRGQGQVKAASGSSSQHKYEQYKGVLVDDTQGIAHGATVASELPSKVSVDLTGLRDGLGDLKVGAKGGDIAQIIANAVQEAIQTAIPSIVQAVKDACIQSIKEQINPHVLNTQFQLDAIDQRSRMDNLRINGLPESQGDSEEAEEVLVNKLCKLAEAVGVDVNPTCDISSCHRVGKRQAIPGARPRQVVVRFTTQRKRDAVYSARFKLKDKQDHRGVFINEDLTTLRYSVLMAAKKAPQVKGVSTKHGAIICKMNDNSHAVLRTPDDLFDIGLDNVNYREFKLNLID